MKRWDITHNHEPGLDILLSLLKSRGIEGDAEVEKFLNIPPLKNYFNELPSDFKKALLKAKKIVNKAIESKIPIIIYGDYDSDGVNATAILFNTIKNEIGYENISYFVPNRFDHGYGLSRAGIDSLDLSKESLIITVDTGITGLKEIRHLKKLGHSVIVTDHHQKPPKLPPADLILWSDEMTGAAISWMLSKALGSKNRKSLALAALGTVTDVFPLLGINRAIVKYGLDILNSNPPLGLQKLIKVSRKRSGEISTYDLGWVLGPRINASGRMLSADDAVRLHLETDESLVEDIANRLNESNLKRQEKTEEMYKIADKVVGEKSQKIIVSSHKDYHEGIIGLVASRLVQKHYRPSVVISLSDNVGKGSVRSIKGVNIIEVLRLFEDLFIDLGGHPMAAGFSIDPSNISVLEKKLIEYTKDNIPEDLLVPTLKVDLVIPLSLVDFDLLSLVEKMKPFGVGNREPVFVSVDLKVAGVSFVGRDQRHMSLKLMDDEGTFFKAIFFGGKELYPDIKVGDKIDLAYSINKNSYRRKDSINLVVKDLKIHT